MRKRSLLLLAGAAAIVASLVVGPAATAGPEQGVGGDGRVHSRPGAAEPSPELGRQLAVCDGLVDNSIFLGGQIRDNNANWVTRLFTGPPKLLKKSPLTTSVHVQPEGELVGRHARHRAPTGARRGRSGSTRRTTRRAAAATRTSSPSSARARPASSPSRRCTPTGRRSSTGVWPAKYIARQGREQAVGGLDPRLQRPLEVPELAEGHPDHGREEPEVHDRSDEARPGRVPLHRRHERSLPGHEGRRGPGDGAAGTAPDRRLPEGLEVRGQGCRRVLVRARRHPVRPEGCSGAQGAVRPAGAHHRDQPSADRLGALPDDRSRPADAAEQHLQDLREGLRQAIREVSVQPDEGHQHPEGQGLHRWARQAERGQRQDLLVPGRRQAVLPLLDDRR